MSKTPAMSFTQFHLGLLAVNSRVPVNKANFREIMDSSSDHLVFSKELSLSSR